jgi:predicted DNA-binding protein (MmcQ/YjbR family)
MYYTMFLLKNFGLFTDIYKVTRLPQRVRGIRTAPRPTWHQNATNDKRQYSQGTRLSYPCKTWKGCSLVGVWNVATLAANFLLRFHFAAIDASLVHQRFTEISPASHNLKKNHWNTIVDQRMADALIVRTCSTACSGYVGAIKKSDCCFHPWCHHRRQNNISTEFPAWMIWLKFALLWGDAAKR